MNNILLKLKKYLPRPSVLRSLVFMLGFGYIGFAYASLFPGPLTGNQMGGEAIGGTCRMPSSSGGAATAMHRCTASPRIAARNATWKWRRRRRR